MAITPGIEQWLKDAGYEYHCFISYPRIRNNDLVECAKRVQEAIENDLALSINNPSVFLDDSIPGGTLWETKIVTALCRSLTMVALCAGIYYHPAHRWCGLEWAAMDGLGKSRLPGSEFRTIIPLIVREESSTPEAVLKTQWIDISRLTLQGRRYYTTKEFRLRIREVVTQIERIAVAIASQQAKTDCQQFKFPSTSAFSDWLSVKQAAPFYGNER